MDGRQGYACRSLRFHPAAHVASLNFAYLLYKTDVSTQIIMYGQQTLINIWLAQCLQNSSKGKQYV